MLVATDVSKNFEDKESGTIHALSSASLSADAGEFVAISGDSGAGKSTLLNLLSGLDTPTTGKIQFDGQDYSQLDFSQMAQFRNKHFGFIFQTPHMIFHKTVLENVMLPWQYSVGLENKQIKERAHELLEYVGMERFKARKPIVLSGGELQRVVFARALLLDPQIIFADEPTGSLDATNSQSILNLLRQQSDSGRIVIMVSHDQSAIDFADRVVYLKRHAEDDLKEIADAP